MSSETAFGVSRFIEEPRRAALVEFLKTAWLGQAGTDPADLQTDLSLLKRWFRPDLTGTVARQAVANLPRLTDPPDDLAAIAFLRLPGKRGLVTPEGRLLLDLLEKEGQAISDRALLRAHSTLSHFYGAAYRERLQEVLEGGDVRPNTFAFVLFLMFNGSIGRANGFQIPDDPDEEASLAGAVTNTLDAFVNAIGAKALNGKGRERLKSNWVLTESAAQLPQLVRHERGRYWIREDDADELPELLAEVLAARRDRPSQSQVEEGLEAAREAYKANRPRLAALNLAHDRPNRIRADLQRLMSKYGTLRRQ